MELKLDPQSSVPLHLQAEELLRELIALEEYRNGKLLPQEVELARQLNIARNTLRHAINKLVYEGLLVRKKGYGTTVAAKGISGRAKNWFSFSREMKELGIRVQNFELHVSWKNPEPDVARFFNVPAETSILQVERLRGKEDFPFVYFISCFNPLIGMTGNEDFSQPLYEMLRDKYGVNAWISQEEVSAIKATPFLCKKLHITSDEPVLFRKRFVYDDERRPVEYNLGYYRGDSFVFTVESERK